MDFDALHRDMVRRYQPHLVCGPETDIVIEGYPRSSNSFTIWMLTVLQGGKPDLRIAHHIHSIENLRLGLHFGKPLLLLLRAPQDAILSYMIYSDRTVEYATDRYVRFHSDVLALPRMPAVVDFETVVSDFNQVVRVVNNLLAPSGRPPIPLSQDLAADAAQVKVMARERAEEIHGDKLDRQEGVPNPVREGIKAELREGVQAYLAKRPEVSALYDKVRAHGA